MSRQLTATLDSLLLTAAGRFPDRPALSLWGRTTTYADLDAAVDRLARRLSEAGAGPGSRVAVLSPNLPALVVALFAAWRCGSVVLPLNARLREYELGRILPDAELTALVSVPAYRGYSFSSVLPQLVTRLPTLRACLFVDPAGEVDGEIESDARGEAQPLDQSIAAILYTSGTTGAPKGALVSHARELAGAGALAELLGLTPDDRCVFVVPISHAFGLTCYLAALAAGSHAVMVESTFSLEPTLDAIEAQAATVIHGAPALFTSLLKTAPARLATLRTGFVAGASCPPQILEDLDDRGIRVLNLFGMTELGAAACCRPDDLPPIRFTTVGRPLPGYQVRIDRGEVQVRGPYVTSGYYQQPAVTAAAFDGPWFRTGDLGSIDGHGYLRISGRAKEVVQVGGLNVFPAEVELFLLTHPDVEAAAVVGVPHAAMGEVLQAFVVPRPGSDLTSQALLQFARSRIAGYKLPYAIHLVPELPLLPSGKPDRAALGQRTT